MRVVGIRELKSRLSEYVRVVREGEHLLITDRGRVVARILPADESDSQMDQGTNELVSRGLMKPAAIPNSPDRYPRMRPVLRAGISSRDLLDAERGER
jgi:prevent-host-death family protein